MLFKKARKSFGKKVKTFLSRYSAKKTADYKKWKNDASNWLRISTNRN